MDQQRVDMYMLTNQKYFPPEKMMYLKEKIQSLPDDKFMLLTSIELKDPTTLLLISIFLGPLGVDRFMLGDIGMGVLKLLTLGLCGVLTIIDWFTISKKTRDLNFNNVALHL
ncbi:MAG: TM2 domain-containing protein [Oscillospiraceae bacterium]|nr:TM2 domain-containing protein [Oscillospiraceae bacterium]